MPKKRKLKVEDHMIGLVIVSILIFLFYNALGVVWQAKAAEDRAYWAIGLAVLTFVVVGKKIIKYLG